MHLGPSSAQVEHPRDPSRRGASALDGVRRSRRKFLAFYPKGFRDPDYIEQERGYKWAAHRRWDVALGRGQFRALLCAGEFGAIAGEAVRIESRTNLLFSFEKMALRDAVRSKAGARRFARGLHDFLHGAGPLEARFERWCEAVADLPRRQTRVLTWPVLTVFGFLAQPGRHIFVKPNVTRVSARACGFDFRYASKPNWDTYASALEFARTLRRDLADLAPRDMMDLQGFIWVQGSSEYDG